MKHLNPLAREALLGLVEPGRAHLVHLGYLALQGLVLFLWWPPRNDLYHVLATGNPPDTLLAVVIALGATHSYYSLRVGAEELTLPGQHSLGEWALASPLPLRRILGGYIAGQLILSGHALLLSSPLLLAAYTVGGGAWPVLLACLGVLLVQALFYRLCGALMYLLFGHRRNLMLVSVRAVALLGYACPPFVLPAASHVMLSYRLFNQPQSAETATVPEPLLFVLIYAGLSLLATLVLFFIFLRHRAAAASARQVRSGSES